MKTNAILKLLILAILAVPAGLFAEEAASESAVKVSGKIFLDWTKNMESEENGEKQNDAYDTFNVGRAYITLKKKLDDSFSARITTDVTEEDGKYNVYLKYAYLQYKKEFNGMTVKGMAGLTKTSTLGFIDDKLTGTRWLNKNFLDSSKTLLDGTKIDNSADLGLNLSVKSDFFEIVACYVNGEGYKDVDNEESDQGKQIGTRLTITPIKGLFVNGYFTNNDTTDDPDAEGDNYVRYYGGGVAWVSDMLRVGANYVIVEEYVADEDQGDMWLVDSWLKFDLNPIAQVPVFLYGRYAMGEKDRADEQKPTTTYMGFGAGYNVNKNVQVAAYFNQTTTSYEDLDDDKSSEFQVKAQVKF